jgi:hypothetical protein
MTLFALNSLQMIINSGSNMVAINTSKLSLLANRHGPEKQSWGLVFSGPPHPRKYQLYRSRIHRRLHDYFG